MGYVVVNVISFHLTRVNTGQRVALIRVFAKKEDYFLFLKAAKNRQD